MVKKDANDVLMENQDIRTSPEYDTSHFSDN